MGDNSMDSMERQHVLENSNQSEGDEDVIEDFILEIRNRRELWDHTCYEYKNRTMKAASWKVIATIINKSELWCKTTWKKERDTYSRKKKALIGKTGQARKKIENSPHFKLMLFLGDIAAVAKTTGNLSEGFTEEEGGESLESSTQDSLVENSSEQGLNQERLSITTTESNPERSNKTSPVYSASRIKKRPVDEVEKELVDFLKKPKQTEDEHHHFGLSIADQLRKLDPAMSAYVKMNIQRVMYESVYCPLPNTPVQL